MKQDDGADAAPGAGPPPFETFEHTADIGLVVRGRTPEALFTRAAEGLVALIVDPRGLREDAHEHVAVRAADPAALLVAWLNELLYLLDTRRFLPRRCRVTQMDETSVTADLSGDIVERGRHDLRRIVKAATYHDLRLSRVGDDWEARVILDL